MIKLLILSEIDLSCFDTDVLISMFWQYWVNILCLTKFLVK